MMQFERSGAPAARPAAKKLSPSCTRRHAGSASQGKRAALPPSPHLRCLPTPGRRCLGQPLPAAPLPSPGTPPAGPSGSGKSTLLRLLVRMHDADAGQGAPARRTRARLRLSAGPGRRSRGMQRSSRRRSPSRRSQPAAAHRSPVCSRPARPVRRSAAQRRGCAGAAQRRPARRGGGGAAGARAGRPARPACCSPLPLLHSPCGLGSPHLAHAAPPRPPQQGPTCCLDSGT